MGRPRKRKALLDRDNNAGEAAEGDEVSDELKLVCQTIDGEGKPSSRSSCILGCPVASRAAAIRSICEAQVSAVVTHLRLLEATLSEDVLNMPLPQFVEQCCPDSLLVASGGGAVEVRRKEELLLPAQEPGLGFLPRNASNAVKQLFLQSATKQFGIGQTPVTLRLPKHGETLVSVNGSPLGSCTYGVNHAETRAKKTRSKVTCTPQVTTRVTRSSMKVSTLRVIR